MRRLTASLLAAALLSPPATASAQSADGLILGSSEASSQHPRSSAPALDATVSSLSLLGSSAISLPESMRDVDPRYPLPTDPSITEAAVVEKRVEGARLERWIVASPAMKRNVEVQIWRAAGSGPAPMLYLLDGVGAPRTSWWLSPGIAPEVFADENVTLVMPTQAQASMYADWLHDDPTLGRHQWETFITAELAPLLDAAPELNFNGRRGIGGLSMGATGAVHIGNRHPGLFDATFGLSGCYSPLDPVGRQNAHMTVTTRGGDVANLYGPEGGERWHWHDTVGNPEGLRGQRVYLAAANGVFAAEDIANYATGNWFDMSSGAVLERGSLECTRQLEAALGDAPGLRVDYADTGTHDWHTFNRHLRPAWEHIRPALL